MVKHGIVRSLCALSIEVLRYIFTPFSTLHQKINHYHGGPFLVVGAKIKYRNVPENLDAGIQRHRTILTGKVQLYQQNFVKSKNIFLKNLSESLLCNVLESFQKCPFDGEIPTNM